MTTYEQAGETYEDVDFLYDGMPAARAFSVLAGTMSAAEDVSPYVKWDSLQATDNGTNGRGLISLRIERTMAQLTTVKDQNLIRVIDHATPGEIARGTIRARKPHSVPGYDAVDIVADDIGGLLDDAFIPSAVRPAETMVVRITYLWTTYASHPLDLDDLSFVAAIGGTLLAQNFAGVTLRQAIEATINQVTSADYYVDATGRLHVFTSESNPAPKDIDADAPSGTEIAPEDLDIDYDSNAYANRVYIQGATPAGSGFFNDLTAQGLVDGMIRTAVVQAPDCETSAMATALANMYLGRVSSAKPRGTFSTTKVNGWRAGQNVLVTSAAHNLTAQSFRIARVTSSIARPGAVPVRKYEVEFGGSRAGGSGVQSDGIGTGQVVSGQLGGAGNVYVTSDGVAVTDGTRVRAQIGHLGAGVYGISITDNSGNVLIDGQRIKLAYSEGTIPAGVALGISQTTVTASGVVVNDGTDDRVILGAIGGGDYGLKVVSSDGVTVIIDGTSNMFKIAATGTLSITGCNGVGTKCTSSNSVVVATGLSVAPVHIDIWDNGSSQAYNIPLILAVNNATVGHSGVLTDHISSRTTQSGADTTWFVAWDAYNVNRSAITRNPRYYLMQEQAL